MRPEVPLFQRQYVWGREQQWEPLWEDVARKFAEFLEGRQDAPVPFLGAMVLDLMQTPASHVEKRQVIDGQQRLTTLQILLSAFRDFCRDRRHGRPVFGEGGLRAARRIGPYPARIARPPAHGSPSPAPCSPGRRRGSRAALTRRATPTTPGPP
jgi:hypothetical protein